MFALIKTKIQQIFTVTNHISVIILVQLYTKFPPNHRDEIKNQVFSMCQSLWLANCIYDNTFDIISDLILPQKYTLTDMAHNNVTQNDMR